MTSERDTVAGQLARYLHAHGLDRPWSDRRDSSTRWLYADDGVLYQPARLRLHADLVAAQRAASSTTVAGGTLAVVVTAGPPGAGKSTALRALPSLAGFRDVDADDFKDPLLRQAQIDGLLTRWTSQLLADGRPVAPRELAGFVHAESTEIAHAMRRAGLAAGENIVIHGTLSDPAYADGLLAELDRHGYDTLIVLDVEAPADLAVEQALDRWWTVRTGTDPFGGRFVPPAAIRRYYAPGSPRSVCADNAAALCRRADDLGWDVDLRTVGPTAPE